MQVPTSAPPDPSEKRMSDLVNLYGISEVFIKIIENLPGDEFWQVI
jgi:hypothetical protein